MRRNIFDIVRDNTNMNTDTKRLITMTTVEKVILVNQHTRMTLFQFVDDFCFSDWKARNHCINVDDYLETLDFIILKNQAAINGDAFLTLIELIYNFWMLSAKVLEFEEDYDFQCMGNYYHIKELMDDVLSSYNHTTYIDVENERVLVIEDKAEVTAVAEIMPTRNLSMDIIRYNHHSLKGDIGTKKNILIALGRDLESKQHALNKIMPSLKSDIFYMLNNLDIRHNNMDSEGNSYKEYVAEMDSGELEHWYDELYQMILLGFLLVDNKGRSNEIKKLKTKIENKADDVVF